MGTFLALKFSSDIHSAIKSAIYERLSEFCLRLGNKNLTLKISAILEQYQSSNTTIKLCWHSRRKEKNTIPAQKTYRWMLVTKTYT